MAADRGFGAVATRPGPRHHVPFGHLVLRDVAGRDIAARPGGNHACGVFAVLRPAQQVIGIIEGNETLGVQGRLVELGRVVDGHDGVQWRVHDQQRLAEVAQGVRKTVRAGIVDEALLQAERPAANVHLRYSGGPEFTFGALDQVQHVVGA